MCASKIQNRMLQQPAERLLSDKAKTLVGFFSGTAHG